MSLDRALAKLERAAAAIDTAPKVTFTERPVRDADHRIVEIQLETSDGRKFRRVPVRDADHRILRVLTQQVDSFEPRKPARKSFYDRLIEAADARRGGAA